MVVQVTNAQREVPVDVGRMTRVARRAVRRLRIRTHGTLSITFIDSQRIRTVNRQFLRHDRTTDVLSFRYDGQLKGPQRQIVGEILIAPRQAKRYAAAHKISYVEELSRYVVHGLLHWLGHDDQTTVQQRKMRMMEDRLLASCGVRSESHVSCLMSPVSS